MSMIIQANMPFINAQNKYKISTGKKADSAEKLSSGYRINRAADDAAGLSISEKLRSQIRGLNRGTTNGEDGVLWVQVADGALNEVHAMLHRMKELTVQSLNDTNTADDRAALQAEMDSLQSEIDRITNTTQFNEKNIFAEHEPTFYQYEGNVKWDQSQIHVLNSGSNQLTVQYSEDGNSSKSITIEVPVGEYTTQELTDEIEDAFINSGVDGINVEYTDDGTFNINLEDGKEIEEVTGGLAKLLYDSYEGGSVGALIGTTSFPNDYIELNITSENNNLGFDVEYFDGRTSSVNITLAEGSYSRPEIIDILNNELAGTGISAQAYGTGIKLGSNDAIITGFKGNMFKIDGGVNPYTSIFYDNVKYGNITTTTASFVGGTVIPDDARDAEHQKFHIKADNNELTFKANGSDTEVTITIPEGEYTLSEMVDKLNELFADNSLELTAQINDGSGYNGITIKSQVKGATSEIGLSSNSSAYETLFVKRVYNSYRTDAVETVENTANRQASFTSSRIYNGTTPYTITEDNNEFVISLDGNEYTIKLNNGVYNTAQDFINELDNQLNGSQALSGYKDKIELSLENNKLKITTTADSKVVNFDIKASGSDTGYDYIFVGKNQTVTPTSVSASAVSGQKPTITLNTPLSDSTTITDADKKLTVTINGANREVTLPTGNVSHDDIVNAINTQLAAKVVTTDNTFLTVNASGNTTSNGFNYAGTAGRTDIQSANYNATGTATNLEGSVGTTNNKPAVVEMKVELPQSYTVDDSNNSFQLTINGTTNTIKLANKKYTRSELAAELQSKINSAFGTGVGGAIVSLNNNKLVFTARMNEFTDGRTTNIQFSTGTSSFIKDLHTKETAGYVDTKNTLNSITITDDSNEFNFTYVEDGVNKTVNITLKNGTYNRTQFVDMLNKQMQAQGVNVTATVNGNAIRLSTNTVGNDGNRVAINSSNLGNSVEAIFGRMQNKTQAVGIANRAIKDSITIDSTNNVFNIKINNVNYSVTLEENTFDRNSFVDMLEEKLRAAGAKVDVSLDSNRLKFTTDEAGSDKNIYFAHSTGGSSMKAIYGQTTTEIPGATASFNSDNKLVLTGTTAGTSLSVSSATGSVLQEPIYSTNRLPVTKQTGHYSTKYAAVDGVNLGSTVQIDEWNNELNFVYKENGNSHNVSLALQEKEYTYDELRDALQQEIDNQLGSGELTVEVSASGVVIKANNAGSNYALPKNNFSGDFYYKVMCSTKEATSPQRPTVSNGAGPKDTAYTVGRKDVKNNPVEIKSGINDTLSLDFTYGNNITTFSIQLDPGMYNGNQLKEALQKKLDEEVVKQGFSKGIIEVGIGGVSTGVVGANDANALNFKLSSTVRLPQDGTYVIDGVKGNAAFSIFYQTDGELVPAYVNGSKDLSEGVTIESGKEDFSFDVEGTNYTITLDSKKYTAEEIINEINSKLADQGAPVTAELVDGTLKISHNKLGERKIENITGGAKQALFYNENGAEGEKEEIRIQLSSKEGDYITIDKPVVNTVSLGINSIAITSPKYANKALTRIDEAIKQVSNIRSDFGAKQNRLEFAINSNKNRAENTQAAESLLRDADMADEMVEYSKQTILMQAGEAMMAQANALKEGVLRLLG